MPKRVVNEESDVMFPKYSTWLTHALILYEASFEFLPCGGWCAGFVLLYYVLLSVGDRHSNSDVMNTGASVSHMKVLKVMHIVLNSRPI